MKKAIVAAIALAIPSVASAGEWAVVSVNDGTAYVIDVESIRTLGSQKTLWLLTVHGEARSLNDGQTYDYAVERVRVFCDREAMQWVAGGYYAIGRDVRGTTNAQSPEVVALPDSHASSIVGSACGVEPLPPTSPASSHEIAEAMWDFLQTQ